MPHNLLNHPPLLQVIQRLPGQATVYFQPIHQHRHSDETVGLDVLVQLVLGSLVENDSVVGLVLDYFAGGLVRLVFCWSSVLVSRNGGTNPSPWTTSSSASFLLRRGPMDPVYQRSALCACLSPSLCPPPSICRCSIFLPSSPL